MTVGLLELGGDETVHNDSDSFSIREVGHAVPVMEFCLNELIQS